MERVGDSLTGKVAVDPTVGVVDKRMEEKMVQAEGTLKQVKELGVWRVQTRSRKSRTRG